MRASQAVNNEVLASAWEVGAFISEKLKSANWGSKTVIQLSEYLRTQEPKLRGYSRANIYNMVALYDFYSSEDLRSFIAGINANNDIKRTLQPEQGQTTIIRTGITQSIDAAIVQLETGQLLWLLALTTFTNHVEILNRCKGLEERVFYVLYANREQLSTAELRRCTKIDTFATYASDRQRISESLKTTYPQALTLFKDELFLDFLGLPAKHSEKKLRTGIVAHMKEFILELGKDFIVINESYPLNVGGRIFKLDLLLFHRGLQCLVGVELKSGEFKPKDLGQLEFYLEALDRDVKHSNENPSIGILLCRETNRSVVEYALSRSLSPTMIAEYKRLLIPKDVLQKTFDEYSGLLMDKE